MKKIISFAMLFLGGAVNTFTAYAAPGNAHTSCDVLSAQNAEFSCQDSSARQELNGNEYAQILGTLYCDIKPLTTIALRCYDDGDDHWREELSKWHSSTLHRNDRDPNALYKLHDINGGGVIADRTYDASPAYFARNGSISAYCQEGFTSNGSSCVKIESVARCQPKNTTHTNGQNVLPVGSDTKVYCYSKNFYGRHKIEDFENSCKPNVDIVVSETDLGKYHTCTNAGTWEEASFERCDTGDDFPGGCNGISNCKDVISRRESGNTSTRSESVSQILTQTQTSEYCVRSSCVSGYQKQGDTCVSETDIRQQQERAQQQAQRTEELKNKCKSTLGTWNGSRCTCKIKDTVLKNDECVCKNSVYELDIEDKKCKLKPEYKNEQELCESSHGSWVVDHCTCDTTKLLKYNPTDKVCVCDGDDYVYNPEQQKCVLTDIAVRRNACNAASGTEWIESEGRCKCTESGKLWNQTMCVYSDDFTKCAGVSDATWDTTGNKCICDSEDKELKNWQCVDTQETIAKGVINTSFPKFELLVSGLEVNKWKSADGTFNVARLASDSIAGAVLGTASGLITSSVVKKNQVKKGFENVRCVVGNQVVAGYGDEFTVGAQ